MAAQGVPPIDMTMGSFSNEESQNIEYHTRIELSSVQTILSDDRLFCPGAVATGGYKRLAPNEIVFIIIFLFIPHRSLYVFHQSSPTCSRQVLQQYTLS
jgi:hypothetical protein